MKRWGPDAAGELGAAVYRGDGSMVVELVRGRLPHEALQLAGDGLFDAVAQRVSNAAELAAECAAALRERDWEGDEELAAQLVAIVNQGPAPMLRPLPIDLDQLSDLLEGDPVYGGGRIDLKTGDCWPQTSIDDADDLDEDDDDDRWLYVWCEGSRPGYRDMERFIATVDDQNIVDRLEIAIRGKGAFRRFKDVLARWPEELQRYFLFSEERQRGRARAWLAENGYRPVRTRKP